MNKSSVRLVKLAISLAAGVFLGSGAAMLYLKSHRPAEGPAQPLVNAPGRVPVDGLVIPPFSLTDHHGEGFDQSRLVGKVTVMSFFFTHCPTVCPIMTEKLAALTDALADTGVRFVSISVDPTHDTPDKILAYGRMHEADLSRWSFLTGDPAVVRHIVADGLKFVMEEDKSSPMTLDNGEIIYNILHPTWFVLIGPDGGGAGIKGLYKSSEPADMEQLAKDARAMDLTLRKNK